MFRDMELSKDINVAFKQHMDHLSNAAEHKLDMSVSVLSMAYWPTYQPMEVNIPGIITIFYTDILTRKIEFEVFFSCVKKKHEKKTTIQFFS